VAEDCEGLGRCIWGKGTNGGVGRLEGVVRSPRKRSNAPRSHDLLAEEGIPVHSVEP